MESSVIVFGVENCEDTQRIRRFLDSRGINYVYVDLDRNKEAEQMVKEENEGKRRTPLVVVQFGNEARKLHVPSNQEVADALRDFELLGQAA